MSTVTSPQIENIEAFVQETARLAKNASRIIAKTPTQQKNEVLLDAAKRIMDEKEKIQTQNQLDLAAGEEKGLTKAMLDRLTLNDKRLNGMISMLEEVAALPDVVGQINDMTVRPSGIRVGKMRVPLGVVGLVYESRPNVTMEASALCLKSGNGCLLRGGSEAIHSNIVLADIMRDSLKANGLPEAAVSFINTTDREAVKYMCKLNGLLDVIIPRGGKSLIEAVVDMATIPVLKHYDGNCHVYVDEFADPEMAKAICVNAKVQRPGVCNAAETLLVHKAHSGDFLTSLLHELKQNDVEVRGCAKTVELHPDIKAAADEDWDTEYLDLIVALKIVDSIEDAIDHLEKHSSSHTESIVTNDYANANKFLREVDSSSVMVNASTRFSDGGEYGLGAEMGISTDKLHARGPMGQKELTCEKFIVFGSGEIRE